MKTDERIRTIITQDAEVDDQNSLRHFLLYTNEIELQGIVQTSSVFHWKGSPGAAAPSQKCEKPPFMPTDIPYDQPHRWPGTEWMFQVIDDYDAVYPNLSRIDPRYPQPEALRSVVKVGNIGYPGETDAPSEGSELIRQAILDDDPRRLYLQVWGGMNTIARALTDIQTEYEGTAGWSLLHAHLSQKIVITGGEQDDTYRRYIAEEWPDITLVHCMQMGSSAYGWSLMPEGEDKDTLRSGFIRKNIKAGKGALLDGYAVWADGRYYPGEEEGSQFGCNPALLTEFWGTAAGFGPYEPYDFLSEGDSPNYYLLLNFGLRSTEDFSYGGFSGRYLPDETQMNSKGQKLHYLKPQQDLYTDASGNTVLTESMWCHVAEIQNDFAARADWCVIQNPEAAERAPDVRVAWKYANIRTGTSDARSAADTDVFREEDDIFVKQGDDILLHAKAHNPSGTPVRITFRIYEDASSIKGASLRLHDPDDTVVVHIPQDVPAAGILHILVRAQNTNGHRLVHYRQVIIHMA